MAEQADAPAPARRLSHLWERVVRLWRLVVAVVVGYRGEALALRAGNLTFITITSIVPLAAVVLMLVHLFNERHVDALVMRFFEDLLSPGGKAQAEATIRKFLSAAGSRTAGSVSFLIVLVSAGVLLRHLDASLNEIWAVRRKRPLLVSLALYAGILLVGPALMGMALLGSDGVKRLIVWLRLPFSDVAFGLGAALSATLVFSLLYKLAPHAPVPFKSALIGGSLAGLAWELARRLYGSIASLVFSANPLYGSLGVAPLFLMWIYVGWYIVLSGARLAYAVEHADFHQEFADLLAHPRSQELIAARVAGVVAAAALRGLPGPTARAIALELSMPGQRISDVLHQLQTAGLVTVEKGLVRPARAPASLTLADLSAAVGGSAGLLRRERALRPSRFEDAARLFTLSDEASVEMLKGISWADLASDRASPQKP